MYSIGITTFQRRLDLLKSLIHSIRNFNKSAPILVAVNADLGEALDEEYRKNILSFFSQEDFLYPLIFPSFTGLSKMWNSLIIHSPHDHVLMLNDDLEIDQSDIFTKIHEQVSAGRTSDIDTKNDLLLINNTWSNFLASKAIIDDLGYFDERLIAFGDEDGDMVWRFIRKYGHSPNVLLVDGIRNKGEGYANPPKNMDVFETGKVFRPTFNRKFILRKYEPSENGIKGMFSLQMNQKIGDVRQYPYERFKEQNFNNLFKFSGIEFEEPERAVYTKSNVRLLRSNIFYKIKRLIKRTLLHK